MKVSNALGFAAPAPAVKRSTAPKVDKETDNESDATARTQKSAQFAAFLSMIVGNNPKLRSELKKQLPDETASLLDQLLASATAPQDPTAADAARYGMMTDVARSIASNAGNAATGTAAAAGATQTQQTLTRAEINAINRARAAELLGSIEKGGVGFDAEGDNAKGANSRISPSVLALVASRKSAALEELLAVGDREAASLKVGLDNVLSKSGTPEGLMLAATHAASAALGAALSASANDVTKPVADTEALDPELRSRLARVIERMKTEHGHDVSVVETVRSQERQDSLYAQGRTTPGAVVTWTRDSLHTQGEAVDVIVDGSWQNAKGFARLQQIAQEEGLETLGMKDPGHLQLPKDSWTLNSAVRVTASSNDGPVSNGIARVATVAQVARVGAGMNVEAAAPQVAAAPQPLITTNGAAGLLQQRDSGSGSNSQSDTSEGQSSKKSSAKTLDSSDSRAASSAYQETMIDQKSKFIGPLDETQRASGSSAADSVERIQDISAMREQQGAKSLSQMTLEIDGENGTTQQVTVDVRGNVVGARISADSVSADRMRANVGELRAGLESRGLEADSVRISTQGARTESVDGVKSAAERDALRMNGAGSASSGSGFDQSAQQGARDKSSAARDWEDKQATREEQRAQNRDAQGRGSGNQDRQRPQYQEKK